MVAGKGEDTALGTAYSRFLESLPRKAIELRGAIALLTATPAAEGPREDMRRRLHTLYASAVVFRNETLSRAVKEGIERLDAARDEGRPLSTADIEVLARLIRRIPELRGDPAGASAAAKAPESALRSASGLGGTRPPGPSAAASIQPVVGARQGHGNGTQPAQRAPSGAALPAVDALPAKSVASSITLTAGERRPLLQRVLSVLVLAAPADRKLLTELLQSECLEPTFVDSARQALESARDSAPDVVLCDEALAAGGKLLEGLRSDPLVDFVPVVLLASAADGARAASLVTSIAGADARLGRPFEASRLLRTLGRVTGTLVETASGLVALGDATVSEVAERVADEIRRGLVDAVAAGRELRVSLGEGAEVLAAAWAAIARVRAFVSEQSAGRVRFGELPSRSTPALLSVGARTERDQEIEAAPAELSGRRIMVVDDDASIIAFFAGILVEHGATVVTVQQGAEALDSARRERPDLVISDVLMPDLDGFALCRRLKRDPVLADVPVILIAWKEDLLARMRELAAGASGYLKKEASWQQVIAAVRDALAARSRLESELAGDGEVRGNLEGTGVVSLLRSVRRARPDARVTLRDAWNLFECELREGRLAQLTRTASDGSFVRGEAALPHLLGASAGRYAVTVAQGALKHTFDGSLDEVLTRGAQELGAQLDALSFPILGRVARVVFDEDAYPALRDQSPAVMRQVVECLHAGEPPAKLAQRGDVAQATLEAILLDMGRRGAIRGVVGSAGEDLFAEARLSRGREVPVELATPRSVFPSSATLDALTARPPSEVAPGPTSAELSAEAPAPEPTDAPPIDAPQSGADAPDAPSAPLPVPAAIPAELVQASAEAAAADWRPKGEPPISAPHPVATPLERRDSTIPPAAAPSQAVVTSTASVSAEPAVQPPVPAPTQPPATAASSGEPGARASTSSERRQALPADSGVESDAAAAEERRSRSTIAAWAVALLSLFAVAFFAERLLEPQRSTHVEAIGGGATQTPEPSEAVPPADAPEESAPEPSTAAVNPPAAPAPEAVVVPQDAGFQIYNGILEPGLITAPNQGLLVVEASARLAGAELSIDQQRVGTVPTKVPLSEGIHELALRRGDAVSYRFVSVRPGKTWVLREP